jgi:hypothetical protein
MLRTAACLLALVAGGLGQDTRPAAETSPFSSDESVRLLAGSVMKARVLARTKDLCALGPRPSGSRGAADAAAWLRDQLGRAGMAGAAILGAADAEGRRQPPVVASVDAGGGRKRVVVSSRLADDRGWPGAHTSASAASGLVECAAVLHASRAVRQLPELPFEVRFQAGEADEPRTESRPEPPILEIRFGDLGLGERRDCMFVLVAAPDPTVALLVPRLRAVLTTWKGRKGFWKEFEIVADPDATGARSTPRLTLACTVPAGVPVLGEGPASRSAGDACAVAGTPEDTPERTVDLEPQNVVNAVRCALLLIVHAGDEHRPR